MVIIQNMQAMSLETLLDNPIKMIQYDVFPILLCQIDARFNLLLLQRFQVLFPYVGV